MPTQDFYDEVIASLGGTLVDVELETSDIDICFKKAKRVMKQKGHQNYRHLFFEINLSKGDVEFTVPGSVTEVVALIPQDSQSSISGDLFTKSVWESLFNYSGRFNYRYNGFDFVTYQLTLQQQEEYRRFGSFDLQYRFDQFQNKVQLIGGVKRDGSVIAECFVDLTDDEYCEIDWVIRWTTMEAKMMLGAAYRKFSAIATPQGDGQLSGSEMIQEAQREKEELLQEIQDYVDGSIDWGGVYMG